MPLLAPTTPKGRKTRHTLIKAARTVLGHQGYVTLRMADVASAAGLSTGALYRYFENKEDLFASVIEDIHEELYAASRSSEYRFATHPYEVLREANLGYLTHYYNNRDVMRAFMEATTVDERFRKIWWEMRSRHVRRFTSAMKKEHATHQINGVSVIRIAEAMTSMIEQYAYCWFAVREVNQDRPSIEEAAETVSRIWHNATFGSNTHPEREKSDG